LEHKHFPHFMRLLNTLLRTKLIWLEGEWEEITTSMSLTNDVLSPFHSKENIFQDVFL
jgi:hypothetical protein